MNSDLRFHHPAPTTRDGQSWRTIETKAGGRAKDGLALIRKLSQEPNDVPCALTIQPRGRFIQEQELGLGSKLDADRKTLPGSNVQRYSILYDDCVSEGLKFQELDNLLDVCVLLLFRDVVWLPQVSGEPHHLTDGSRAFADRKGFDLSQETESVWALLRDTLLLVIENGGTESFLITLLLGLMNLVLVQRSGQIAVVRGGAECVLESLGDEGTSVNERPRANWRSLGSVQPVK